MIVDLPWLEAVIAKNCAVPENLDPHAPLPGLMDNLGSPDSDLRENSLTVLWEWIAGGIYSDETLCLIGNCMAQNLSSGVGQRGDDSVFLRTFSALILGTVVNFDQACFEGRIANRKPFVAQAEVLTWLDQTLAYLRVEQDWRGYVEVKGWAHAAAHTADLLTMLAWNHHLDTPHLEGILHALAEKLRKPADAILSHDEDERLGMMMVSVLLRDKIEMPFFDGWLNRLVEPLGSDWQAVYTDPGVNYSRINIKTFLRSVYFQLSFGWRNLSKLPYFDRQPAVKAELLPRLEKALKDLDRGRFYRSA